MKLFLPELGIQFLIWNEHWPSFSKLTINEVTQTSTEFMRDEESDGGFQSTRSQRPRQLNMQCMRLMYIFQSTRSQRPRLWIHFYTYLHIHFNPRGRKDLDKEDVEDEQRRTISIHEVAKTSTYRPCGRGCFYYISIHEVAKTSTLGYKFVMWILRISIHEVAKTSTANPSKNQIPSPAKSIFIIQPPHDYFHQIIISTLYFIHFSPKTGANPPANPWELTVRTN